MYANISKETDMKIWLLFDKLQFKWFDATFVQNVINQEDVNKEKPEDKKDDPPKDRDDNEDESKKQEEK